MIFEYVRDTNRRKIGILVALNKNQIGWSKCNIKKDRFDKEMGLKIAIGRANKAPLFLMENYELPRDIHYNIRPFINRVCRYFKHEPTTSG